ncbi:MAG: hypothetical protein AB1750_10840, partial [Chloroflexota bacterium]
MLNPPPFSLLEASHWRDYELLDSGDGLKLERFGPYIFVRPEAQAMWSRALSRREWDAAHAVFQPTAEESGGHWAAKKKMAERWEMGYDLTPRPPSLAGKGESALTPGPSPQIGRGDSALPPGPSPQIGRGGTRLRFWAMTTPGRHLGVFPEVASHWDWMADRTQRAGRPASALNLFGYT